MSKETKFADGLFKGFSLGSTLEEKPYGNILHNGRKHDAGNDLKKAYGNLSKAQGVPKGVDPGKHEDCVQQVKDQGHDKESAIRICNDSLRGQVKKSISSRFSDLSEEEVNEFADLILSKASKGKEYSSGKKHEKHHAALERMLQDEEKEHGKDYDKNGKVSKSLLDLTKALFESPKEIPMKQEASKEDKKRMLEMDIQDEVRKLKEYQEYKYLIEDELPDLKDHFEKQYNKCKREAMKKYNELKKLK